MPKSTNVMGEFQLAEMISRCLRNRRYNFVFDDVWSSGVLDYFKYALPNNNCGSRIVVASRSAEVASAFKVPTDNSWSEAKKGLDSDSKDVHHYYLNPLPHNYAWSLFCKKAFQSESCPPELENLSWKIIDKCSGLALVIVAIGGLLSTKERNVKAWKGMLESIDWEKDEGYQFRHVMRLEKSRAPEAEHVTETEGAKSAEIEHAIMGLEKGESPEIEHVRGTEKAKSPKVEHVMAVDRAKSFEMEHVTGADRAKTPKIEHVMGTEKDRISEIQHARGTEKVVNRKVEHVTQVEKAKSPKLEHVMRILSISYKDLPCNIKSCFLYFSMFPKNYSIKRVTLIRLWIAEGSATSEEGKTLEEVALGYLNELMQRGKVQVSEFYDYGRVRTCRIHNLFREIIIVKSEEENFGSSLTREIKKIEGTVRRLSIFEANDDLLQNMRASYLRAVLLFGSNAIGFPSMLDIFYRFKLLRILDLEGAPVEMLPKQFGSLLNLRYLSLRNTKVSDLPKSLRKLINLQTLDLKGTYVSELPSRIIKLKNLRHLLAYRYYIGQEPPYYYALGIKVPQGIGRLGELQKLIYLDANQESGVLRELAGLTQLRRLGIVNLRNQDGLHLCSSVSKMKKLHSLSVSSIYIEEQHEQLDLQYFEPPEMLERLYLRGPSENLPPWFSFLHNLKRLQLRWSKLAENSLEVLHGLPNLVELVLVQAYERQRLHFNRGFPELKMLALDLLANLESVNLEGVMPNLQKIYIRSCKKLFTVPEGIEQLSSLKELHLFDMDALMDKLREGGGQKVNHIPVLRSYHIQRYLGAPLI